MVLARNEQGGTTMGTTATETKIAHELLSFIGESPTAYQAIASIRRMLDAEGFTFLPEQDAWDVRPGGCYYTVRNGSSIVAFKVGSELDHYHFQISASHADSPTFKVKAVPELSGPDGYLRLNVEPYGGMIDFTWLDRPLSVAGRVMVEEGQAVRSHLLAVDRDLFLIPGVAIHMNRQVNEGFAFNHQVDLIPLMSAGELSEGAFVQLLADELGVRSDQVLAYALNLVN
ncbi:MAG: M18 family aminopeptidase, partial [Atopobiaceae bacterium]|nr:M18 family aminopeptidase [Atopobiaceae bacterium]